MGETFRTLYNGVRQDSDGQYLDEELQPLIIRYTDATVTGTQLQGGNTTPIVIKAAVSGKTYVPIAWHAAYDNAGGTAFSGNASLELLVANVVGEATNAISGSTDKITSGTIASNTCDLAAAMAVQVKTGDPTGGHADASVIVRVWYVVV